MPRITITVSKDDKKRIERAIERLDEHWLEITRENVNSESVSVPATSVSKFVRDAAVGNAWRWAPHDEDDDYARKNALIAMSDAIAAAADLERARLKGNATETRENRLAEARLRYEKWTGIESINTQIVDDTA